MHILILSDSLTLPRNGIDDQVLDYEKTWPKLLSNAFPDAEIVRIGIGSATTSDLLYQTQYWTGFPAGFTFVQAGLCDCRPRAFTHLELEIIKRLPGKREFWKRQVDKRTTKYRRIRNLCYTSESDFTKNLIKIKETLPNVHWINIAQRSGDPSHLIGTSKQIRRYNQIISQQFEGKLIDVSKIEDSLIMSDHFHLNADGHQWLYHQVKRVISSSEIVRSKPSAASSKSKD